MSMNTDIIEETIEEYTGLDISEESTYQEMPEMVVEEKPKFYEFVTIKNFENKINYAQIEKIKSNLKYCTNIVDFLTDAVSDDLLEEAVRAIFPNVEDIKSAEDRVVLRKMLLQGNTDYLFLLGHAYLDSLVKESRHLGIIFNNKKEEIAGCYQIIHRSKIACDIVIFLRGSFKDRAKTAKEMIIYFGSRYINLIAQEGYEHILATTLNKTHASLVENIRKKECKILVERLKNENPDRSAEEINEACKKLLPGFKNTGTVMPRYYEGVKVWETNWRYDLKKKFNEHI